MGNFSVPPITVEIYRKCVVPWKFVEVQSEREPAIRYDLLKNDVGVKVMTIGDNQNARIHGVADADGYLLYVDRESETAGNPTICRAPSQQFWVSK
jgi:hypothetical protein